MRLSVGIEIAVMVLLLLVSATLAHTPPPGRTPAVTGAVPDPLEGMVMEGDYHLTWRLSPGAATPDGHELTLRFQRHDGTPVDPLAISASFASKARGIEALAVDMSRTDAGSYVATVRGLTAPGEWQLAFDILVTDFDKLVLEMPVTLR
jgi:hypothetical protein